MTDYNDLIEEYEKAAAPHDKEHYYYNKMFWAVDQIRKNLLSIKEAKVDYDRFLKDLRKFLVVLGVIDHE